MTDFLSRFDAYHDMAVKATGLSDFGPDDYQEPLRLLLADYGKGLRFNQMGLEMTGAEIVGHLVGRLTAQEGFKRNPEAVNMPIARPLIVVGVPRTGTTVLSRLLAQDPAMQSLPFWLASLPMPRPARETWESNPAYRQVVGALEEFYASCPIVKQIHPIAADEADECRTALEHSFWSVTSSTCSNLPEYREWLLNGDARYAYRFYRKILGLIAAGDSRRWLLKDPSHLFGMDALLDVFPDACIVQTHRDPVTAITSVASLTYQIRKVREDNMTPFEHGECTLANFAVALNKAERVRKQHDPAQFLDIHNDEIRDDPVATVEKIYRHFGFSVTEEARHMWRQRALSDPSSGHGEHHYSLDEFGFTAKQIHDSLGDYYDRYTSLYGATTE